MSAKHDPAGLHDEGRIGDRRSQPCVKDAKAEEARKEVENWLKALGMLK
jgi:hypothetical protein